MFSIFCLTLVDKHATNHCLLRQKNAYYILYISKRMFTLRIHILRTYIHWMHHLPFPSPAAPTRCLVYIHLHNIRLILHIFSQYHILHTRTSVVSEFFMKPFICFAASRFTLFRKETCYGPHGSTTMRMQNVW